MYNVGVQIEQLFDDAELILKNLRKKIESLDKKFSEIKEILQLIASLEQKILEALKMMHSDIDEHTRMLKEHKSILDEHTRMLKEHKSILDEHTRMLKEHGAKLESISKDVADIKVSIRRITYDIEAEALEIVPLYLERVLKIYIPVRRFEISGVIEINIYGEADDTVIIGECKVRIGPSSILEVLRKAIKLSRYRGEITTKKIILVVYGVDYIELAKEFAERGNVTIITPRGIITPAIPVSIEKIKDSYEELKRRISQ